MGQAGFIGHIRIGDNVKVAAKTGVTKNVKDNEVLMGEPALPAREFTKNFAVFKNLHKLYTEFIELKRKIKESASK